MINSRAYAAAQGEVVVFADSWWKVRIPRGLFSADALLVRERTGQVYRLYLRSCFGSLARLTLKAVRLNGGSATLEEIERMPMCGRSIEQVMMEVMK